MSSEGDTDIDLQIKALERDKRLEEIKQLRTKAKRSWITPTAIAALLPLIGTLCLWIYGEAKQFSEGYRAVEERDQLKEDKLSLERKKNSLNIEIGTLVALKTHYASEAKQLRQEQTILEQDNAELSADHEDLLQQRDRILAEQKQLKGEYESLTELLIKLVDAPGLSEDQRAQFKREIRLANLKIETIDRIIQQDNSQIQVATETSVATLEEIEEIYGKIVSDKTVFKIPVVIHVVYGTEEENISDDQIKSQLKALNEDYRAKNADLAKVPEPFKKHIGDAHIEFSLADRDPAGNPTGGIVRVKTEVRGFDTNGDVKSAAAGGSDPWQTEKFLNIWVCALRGGLLQMSQFPGETSEATDGVVVSYQAFGTMGTAREPFNKGRALTSGVAQYLNLRHIWGDDQNSCTGSDFVADTPNQAGPNSGKPSFPHITCDNGPHGDMFMNFMDYGDDESMYMFTKGQVVRMHETLSGIRSRLVNKRPEPLEAP